MVSQSVRKAARRAALDAQAKRRRVRAESERWCSALGVDAMVALSERDAAIERHERTAGHALTALTHTGSLTLAEACGWSGDLSIAEAKRLCRLVEDGESGSSRW